MIQVVMNEYPSNDDMLVVSEPELLNFYYVYFAFFMASN